jgi:CDP-6-deoxy-D-xylo-4-hexulose-3-dehydrase
MSKKEQILQLVAEYIQEKHASKTWKAGEDWVQYAGPVFDETEYVSTVNALLNEWLVLGTDAITFENKFPPLLGKSHGIVVNSGSSANLLMMAAMTSRHIGFPKGTKVIVPVAGFPTTLNPILQLGFKPVFVDIEIDTLNLNLDQVEKAAKDGAKILTFAHVLGNPPNMDKLMEIVTKYNLILLEDCCDALGSTYRGKPLGSFGRLASCSFYPAHHITMGEGGFVTCNTKEDETILRSFREWGRGCYCVGKKANLLKNGSCGCRFKNWLPSLPNEIFDHKYVYEEIGYNLKPIELQCSMGLAQLNKLPMIHKRRKENYARLFDIFREYEEFFHLPRPTQYSDPSWFAFPITIKRGVPFKRAQICGHLEDNKIQTRNYFGGNLLLQPAYQNVEWEHPLIKGQHTSKEFIDANLWNEGIKNTFPIATKVTIDTFFLGTSPVITSEQLDYVREKVDLFMEKY